jgi:predicted phosphodiesterase
LSALARIAVISDIHGNLSALEAVLADIRKRGVDRIYNLGDLDGKGPDGPEVIDLCREVCDVNIFGNWDELITRPDSDSRSVQWHRQRLGPERLAWLKSLPLSADFRLSGRHIRLFHASAQGVWHRVFPHSDHETLLAMFENTELTGFDHPPPDIVGYGDIHHAFIMPFFIPKNKMLFNAGSVGNALDEPRATYVLLEGVWDEADWDAPFGIELVRLPYDIESVIARARALNMPHTEELAIELREAIYRGMQKKGA